MNDEHHSSDTNLTETMAARIEIEPVTDPAVEKEIADAVSALEGVTDFKIEKGAIHVSYDPLITSERKIADVLSTAGGEIKAADSETEAPHPDLPRRSN